MDLDKCLHDDKKWFGESRQDSKEQPQKWKILWQKDNWRTIIKLKNGGRSLWSLQGD